MKILIWLLAALAYIGEFIYVNFILPFCYSRGIIFYNSFSKEQRVAFEKILEGFEDALVMSENVNKFVIGSNADAERTAANGNFGTVWRPQPYISTSYSGTDMTNNFNAYTQLTVPARLGFQRSAPFIMSLTEMRDALQENRLGVSARNKLASDINVNLLTAAANQGTLIVKQTAAASGFADIALAEAIMNEQGIAQEDRKIALSTRDYNGMAANLAARQTMNDMPTEAFKRAYVGEVASFDTFKLDYGLRLGAAAGVTCTITNASPLYYTPIATQAAASGDVVPVDNRYQNISINVTSGTVKVGDAFVLANVDAVHHITKLDTGQSKTFRITGIVSGAGGTGVVTISPPIIAGASGGGTPAELQYQNVSAAPVNGAAITWLNTATAYMNPFWVKDAIELLPGYNAVPTDAGVAVMKASTANGIEVTMQKFYDINTGNTKFRLDVLFGVCVVQPEMVGMMLFNQI